MMTSWFFAAGCGEEKKCSISGKITHGGQPLAWKTENSQLLVIFSRVGSDKNDEVYSAQTDRDQGTFTIKNIPPGEYIVAVQQFDPLPGNDAFGHQFNLAKSTIRKTVGHDGQVIDVDVPKESTSSNTAEGKKMPGGKATRRKNGPSVRDGDPDS
jgi:hypothetical protein